MPRILFLLAAAALASCGGSSAAGDPFRDLGYEDALAAAGREGKVVLIDFFATWCAPCKELDRVTWSDGGVRAWLAERTVPLKVDAERERDLAMRFRVRAYPTIVLVSPAGEELGRLLGFKPPATFLSQAGALLERTPHPRGIAAERGGGPRERMEQADALAARGEHAAALEQYLWAYDRGLEVDPSFAPLRLTVLLERLADLARNHPPARTELARRRDRARDLVLGSWADSERAVELAALDRALGEEERTLKVVDALKNLGPEHASALRILLASIPEVLLEARRYDDFLHSLADPAAKLRGTIEAWQAARRIAGSRGGDGAAEVERALAGQREELVELGAGLWEALLGRKRTEEARGVAGELVEVEGSGATYALLVRRAVRAGDPESANWIADRGLAALEGGERDLVAQEAREIPR